jgi:uncharacterized membrane protein HdeD (DUF308 family)
MNQTRTNQIFIPGIMILMGLILLLAPGHTLNFLVTLLGWGLILGGISALIPGIMAGSEALTLAGIPVIILGIFFISSPRLLVAFIPILVGLGMVVSGGRNLYYAWTGRFAMNYDPRRDVLISVIAIALGLLILINPFKTVETIVMLIGIALIYNGVTSLLVRNRRYLK